MAAPINIYARGPIRLSASTLQAYPGACFFILLQHVPDGNDVRHRFLVLWILSQHRFSIEKPFPILFFSFLTKSIATSGFFAYVAGYSMLWKLPEFLD